MEFVISHKAEILGILWIISEMLGENKKIAANSIFGLVKQLIKNALGK
jgi:hypothetical protein